jgi:hypothetical protein
MTVSNWHVHHVKNVTLIPVSKYVINGTLARKLVHVISKLAPVLDQIHQRLCVEIVFLSALLCGGFESVNVSKSVLMVLKVVSDVRS